MYPGNTFITYPAAMVLVLIICKNLYLLGKIRGLCFSYPVFLSIVIFH